MPADQAAKAAIRDRVWTTLEASGASAAAHGRIPDFVGSDRAADRMAELPHWQQARTVKAELAEPRDQLANRHRTADVAPTVPLDSLPPIDFIICGSVAVNYDGVRVGKGAGYTDIEVALLAGAGLLKPDTTIVTTVHEQQVLNEVLPHEPHDFTVDYIVTP